MNSVRNDSQSGGGLAGHLVAAALACALTVSIVGSIAYLGIDYYRKREERQRISDFVSALEHRSPQELSTIVDELKKRRGLASRVIPTVLRTAKRDGSHQRQVAAVEVSEAFIDEPGVEDAFFALRLSRDEVVAAKSVAALARLAPPERAVRRLVECLDAPAPIVADAACCGMVDLGDPGATALRSSLGKFDVERRIWVAGLLADRKPPGAASLLEGMLSDSDVRVRQAAARSVGQLAGEPNAGDDQGVARARQWLAARNTQVSKHP